MPPLDSALRIAFRPSSPTARDRAARRAACAAAALVALLAARAPAQLSAFTWTLGGDPGGSGFVTDTLMHITSSDDGLPDGEPPGVTHFTTLAAQAGTVSCTFDFKNLDTGFSPWHFEHPVYLIDGAKLAIGDPATSFSEIFEVSFHVTTGQSFGLGLWSVDCSYGPSTADITNFLFTPDPGTWTDLGNALRATVDFTSTKVVGGPAGAFGATMIVCGCGDVNGDDVPDLAEGRPGDHTVRVISGANFSLLHEWSKPGRFGAAIAAAGDMDQDGFDDVLVGAPTDSSAGPSAGRAYVIAGLDGSVIHVVSGVAGDELGTSVAGGISVDNDTIPDFLVGLPRGPTLPGNIYAYKGVDATIRYTFHASPGDPGTDFGSVMASTDPVPGGKGDAVVADPAYDGGRGRVYVFSMVTGGLKATWTGASAGAGFGRALAGAGDIDGNGMNDFLVGAPFDSFGGVAAGTVSVYLFKGFATSQLLAVYGGDAAGEAFGSAVAGGRDVDFDGLDDLVIGAPQYGGGAGRVVVRNGLDGTLHANAAGVPGESVGTSVALLGPIDAGNSASAVATSLPKGPGATVILHDVVGTAGPPSLVGTGTLHDLAPTELLVTQGKPVSPLWFVVGLTAVHLPLKGGVLVPSPDMILPGMTDAAGDFSLGFAWPPGLPPLFELRYQAWIADPQGVAGFTATNGLLSKGPPVP